MPPSPAEQRATFLADLEAEAWVKHQSDAGWSIWYPPNWELISAEDGRLFLISSAVPPGLFTVGGFLDVSEFDAGSLDYLIGNIAAGVGTDLLKPFDPEAWFQLDVNFDGEAGLVDIYGFELEFATDITTGDPIPEGSRAPVWWYGYYDPDARPATGYIFQIFGTDALAYQIVDVIVLSFEPPGGFPDLSP